jgi:prophage regulatory protein
MSINDAEELHNAIRVECLAVDQRESAEADQGDSTKPDEGDKDFLGARDLEALTGTKASTWRYWASIGEGPASFKLGRRRVWKKSIVLEWLAEQENRAG